MYHTHRGPPQGSPPTLRIPPPLCLVPEMTRVPPVVQEELALLETVKANLSRLRREPRLGDHDQRLMELRDSLADEKLQEDIASVFEEMERTAALRDQQARSVEGEVDPGSPYFGHLVVEDELGKRAVLIGRSTLLSDRVRIVDWRNAPISRVFYQYTEGDEYEEEIAGRMVSGEVLVRRAVAIAGGELTRVGTFDETWVRGAGGTWSDLRDHEAKLAGGAGKAVRATSLGTGHAHARRDRHLPEIASLLDPKQFALITRPDSGVVVIQGTAGSGKTTVGLHRIAYLHYLDPERFRPSRMLVVVFSRALASYIAQVLPALGVEGVKVEVFDRWAERVRKSHFPELPEVYSDETPGLVTRFKTHVAMLRLLDEVARERKGDDVFTVFEETLTDRGLLESAAERWAEGEFSADQIAKIHRWCTDQHFLRFEGEGPNEQDVPTLDREDDAILLRLRQGLVGPLLHTKKEAIDHRHLMVDEAQDLSPVELAVLVGTAGKARSVTLAGDVAQQIAKERATRGWTEVLDALDLAHVPVSPLQVSYRSTRQIMEVARDILGPLAPEEPVATTREGAPVAHLRFGGMGEAVLWLKDALSDLMLREPMSYVAVLAPDLERAIDWWRQLDRAEVPHVALVDDQDFRFAPGIEVTDIRSSKGLEFDYVLVVEVDAATFPDEPHARHLLHVGATRAAHQLWLVSTGRPSPLVPPGLPGLVEG